METTSTLTSKASLRTAYASERWPWYMAAASLIAFGIILRLLEVTYDRFEFDEYHLRMGVADDFATYSKAMRGTESLQFVVHYWLSYRLLGGSALAFRSLSLLSAVALLVLTAVWMNRAWPERKVATLVAVGLLAVNGNALYLSRYAMFPYGFSFLVAGALFFLFMRLAEGPLGGRRWLWIALALPMVAFFSNEFLIVPLATGVFCVLVLRWVRLPHARSVAGQWQWAWEMKPLLIIPLVFAVKQVLLPYTLWGAAKRADQVDLYYPTAGYAPTVAGAGQFLLDKTYALFASVLEPIGFSQRPTLELLFLTGCGALAAVALVQVVRRRADGRTVFTVLFLLVTLAAMAVGSLLGLYPYGIVRYAPYLFMPTVALISVGAAIAWEWLFGRLRWPGAATVLLVALSAVVLAAGVYLAVVRSAQTARIEQEDEQAIVWLAEQQPDLILADNYIATVLYTKAPQVYQQLHAMGWGTYMQQGQDVVPPAMAETIAGDAITKADAADSILVVLYPNELGRTDRYEGFNQRFPTWSKLVEENFDLVASTQSLHVAAFLYHKR